MHEKRLADPPFPASPPRKIFIGSMSDIMLAPTDYLISIFNVICQSKYRNHTFQILTKRPDILVDFDSDYLPMCVANNYLKIWAGTSTENQEWADNRIPLLLQTSFVTKWISCEPLLGPIDLSRYIGSLKWVVVGGETGPNARPMNAAWVRSIRDICVARGVPFFFKSWGEWIPIEYANGYKITNSITRLDDDGVTRYIRLGKSHTGREIDGQEYNQFPI